MGEDAKDYLPHGVSENEFLERLNPEEIRRKTFEDAKVLKKWLVIIDATELDEGFQKKNEYYLSRCYNKGTEKDTKKYIF